MKIAISIVVAVVMPFGFFVLAGIILGRVLATRRLRVPQGLRAFLFHNPANDNPPPAEQLPLTGTDG